MDKIKIAIDSDIITSSRKDIRQFIKKLINRKDIFDLYVADDTRPIYGNDFKFVNEQKSMGIDLYISAYKEIASAFNCLGVPTCYVDASRKVEHTEDESNDTITFAFDCDCVLFDSEAEDIYKENGLEAFEQYEWEHSKKELNKGPFYSLLEKLNNIKKEGERNIKIVACTARCYPADARALYTFDRWDIDFNMIFFCGNNSKGETLKQIEADIFFDDNIKNVEDAEQFGVLAGQVV